MRFLAPIALSALAALAIAGTGGAHRLAKAAKCPVFPRSSAWNQRVDKLPRAADSDTLVASIGLNASVHADFGEGLYDGGPIGIPYTTVGKGQRKVPVSFDYADESDKGPYPLPANAPIEGGPSADGDRHVIVVDRDACRLYELFDAHPQGARWHAGSGAIFDLRSNHERPKGWTSADAAGLPIFPGLARPDDLRAGSIDHALRFTAPRTRSAFVPPARHFASDSDDPALPPMGLRVRLKASFDTSGFPRQARMVLTALKRYGAILADNGSPWYLSGSPSRRWSNDALHSLGRVTGRDFEVVDTSH